MTPPRGRIELLEIVAALVVVVWRALCYPISQSWRDIVLLLAVYLILDRVWGRTRNLQALRILFMAYLMGIYIQGHFHFTLSPLRS